MIRRYLICIWLSLALLMPFSSLAYQIVEDDDGLFHIVFSKSGEDSEKETEDTEEITEEETEESTDDAEDQEASVKKPVQILPVTPEKNREKTQESSETEQEIESVPLSVQKPVREPAEPYKVVDSAASETGEDELLLSFLGDCCIGDNVKSLKRKNSMTGAIAENGMEWLFSTVSDTLQADDFTFANLECVLSDSTSPLYPLKVYNFVAPSANREVLRSSGIDGINTVNNHCIDFKYSGYKDTLANLEALDIVHFGTLNPTRATNRFVHLGRIEIKGIRIGITGFSYPDNNALELIRQDIQTLREEGCQIVIVSLHWGTEEKGVPNKGQFPFAQKVLDAGADVIWGHHPHVLQPVYFYHGKPIFFSTGNFVFGTIQNLDPASGIFQLSWKILEDGSVRLSSFNMIPVLCRHDDQEYRPEVLENPADQADCWAHVIGKERDGFDALPSSFTDSGIVYLLDDGTLSDRP